MAGMQHLTSKCKKESFHWAHGCRDFGCSWLQGRDVMVDGVVEQSSLVHGDQEAGCREEGQKEGTVDRYSLP